MSTDQAYALWGNYSDPEHATIWLPDLATFLEERYPTFKGELEKEMVKGADELKWPEVVDSRLIPFWVVQRIGAHLRAAWITDEAEAAAFVKMAETQIAYADCGCGECVEGVPAEEDEDNCPIHGEKDGDICADCHWSYKQTCCFRGTCEQVGGCNELHVESTCWGCRENQPNQLAHTDPGGCLFQDYDADEIY
jgi:hypothetical protein